MRKHRTALLLLVVTSLLLLLVFVVLHDNEPTYHGHSLSYWLQRNQESSKARRTQTEQPDSPKQAILAIGTNAIPWLLKWIRYEPNPVPKPVLNRVQWTFWNTRIGGMIMFGTGRANSRAEAAVLAFDTLGTNAAPALNNLVLLMQDSTHPMTSVRATMALGGLGQCALPALAQALFTPTQHERQLVALELFEMSHDPAIGTNRILPFVRRALNDPDPQLSRYASKFLARIAPGAITNAPSQ
jgi:hypothetical protein